MIFLEACGVAFSAGLGFAIGRTVVLGLGELYIERRIQRTNAVTMTKIRESAKLLNKDDPGYKGGGYA